MKVIDSVKKNFFEYPTLYLRKDFDATKFSILHHKFIVLGNGIEWAKTKKVANGGYLVEPKYKGRGRSMDADYGVETCDIDITPYFQGNKIYELELIDHRQTQEDLENFKFLYKGEDGLEDEEKKNYFHAHFIRPKFVYGDNVKYKKIWLESEFDKLPPKTIMPETPYDKNAEYFVRELQVREEEGLGRRDPYPNFSKEYSCFYEKGAKYIQDDWRAEAIFHFEHWKEYFNDTERVKTYSHNSYGNERVRNDLFKTIRKFINEDNKSIKEACAFYGFAPCDVNDESSILQVAKEKWETHLSEIQSFIDETIFTLKK